MALWKKILIGITVLIIIINIKIALYINSMSDMCRNNVITEVISPNGQMKAVTFQRNCGATTDFSTHVIIIPIGNALEKEGNSVFVADTNHGKAPAARNSGPEVSTCWLSANKLQVKYHTLARVRRSETKSMGSVISYVKFQ